MDPVTYLLLFGACLLIALALLAVLTSIVDKPPQRHSPKNRLR